ncbi:hypothetical protein KNCP2_14310 [Candidatus Rickettsia kedanie]|uniref:Uncharacterized protein n=1 Tax=Candidatus Rickettsia kedanie TaxID=3115352 RepID=A0ABP9TV74_9RICK
MQTISGTFYQSFTTRYTRRYRKYLGSGLIKDIGPYFTKKLVLAFKDRVLEVIEHEPHL